MILKLLLLLLGLKRKIHLEVGDRAGDYTISRFRISNIGGYGRETVEITFVEVEADFPF